MTLYWWSCPWCGDRMQCRHTEAEVVTDRDAHLANTHPQEVSMAGYTMAGYMLSISHYQFRDAH